MGIRDSRGNLRDSKRVGLYGGWVPLFVTAAKRGFATKWFAAIVGLAFGWAVSFVLTSPRHNWLLAEALVFGPIVGVSFWLVERYIGAAHRDLPVTAAGA